jgi:hypothetical protein
VLNMLKDIMINQTVIHTMTLSNWSFLIANQLT